MLPTGFIKAVSKDNEIGPNELVYEDDNIIVERKDNQLIQTGKPFQYPIEWLKELKEDASSL